MEAPTTPTTVDRERPRTGDPILPHLDADPTTGVHPRLLAAYGAGPWHVFDRLAPWNVLSGLAEPVTTLCGVQAQATAIAATIGGEFCPRCVELSSPNP